MSYIATKLNGIFRSRLLIRHIIARQNVYSAAITSPFHVNSNNHLPGIEFKNQFVHQIHNYSTNATKVGGYEGRVPKILNKLASNRVSLQFDKFTSIRKSLFRNYDITVEKGFDILKSCSQLVDRNVGDRLKLVNDAWNELEPMIGSPTKNQLIMLLQAYRRAGLKSLNNHREFFEKYNCPIDADIYAELLYIISQNGESMEKAETLLKEMSTENITPNEKFYNALILGNSKQGIDAVENVLKTMDSENIEASSDTYTELIKAYVQNGNTKKALELLQQSTDFNTDQLFDIIRNGALRQNEEIVEKALSMLPEVIRNAKLIAPNLQNICIEMVYANRHRALEAKLDPYQLIIQHLPVPVFDKEDKTEYGTFLIKEMIVANENVSNILQFCEKLIESNRNLYSIHSCCMYSLVFNLPEARDYLQALATKESLRPHYFWPLFVRAKDQNDVIDIICFAKKVDIVFDVETLKKYILPRMNTLVISQEAVKALLNVGVRMLELKTALIAYLLDFNRPKEALDIACRSTSAVDPFVVVPALGRFIKGPKYKRNAYTVATIIKKLQSQKQTKNDAYDLAGQVVLAICNKQDKTDDFVLTKQLISDYGKLEVKISQNSADGIIGKINRNRTVHSELSPIIKSLVSNELFPETHTEQPKIPRTESEIESLEKQLSEFQANGLPQHGILFQLFKKTVQLEQWNRALEIKKKCDAVGVIETPAMLSTLLRLWTATKNVDEALQVLATLQKKHPSFKLDSFKVIDLAKVLIQMDRLQDAVKLIENLTPIESDYRESLSFNIWHLLNAACEYGVKHCKEENISELLLQMLASKGYCEYSKALLGTVIKEHLEMKRIHEAVAKFEQCVMEYKQTPQTLSLLIALIDLSNNENIEEFNITKSETIEYIQHVIDLSKEIHGTENANVNVILAFACTGNENQLRKIFMNPIITFNPQILIKSLDYLKNKSKIGALVTIARSARGLQHTCLEEDQLYELLLGDFVRTNDFTSAIQLYEQMQHDDNSSISKKFCTSLAELLKKNNQPLPAQLRIKVH